MMIETINEETEKQTKSRHLPILDYFEMLQLEYIQADLRAKIYPRLKDKDFWGRRVREGKRITIEKLAEKNHLPSIFTDEGMRREFEKKVYRDKSYPIFTYRDKQNELEQSYYDLKYYYHLDSDVRVDLDDEVKTGKISREFIPIKDNTVWVNIKGEECEFPIKIVTRIL